MYAGPNLLSLWLHVSWLQAVRALSHHQGWGLLNQFLPFRYLPHFSAPPKYMLAFEYHVNIWQVSPQHSCGDNCQIWTWCKESNRYFCKIKNFAYGEINARSFGNPQPRPIADYAKSYVSVKVFENIREREFQLTFCLSGDTTSYFLFSLFYFSNCISF